MKKHISYSQISMYNKCPKWWYGVYKLGIKRETNIWAQMGSIVHNYIATGEWQGEPGVVAEAKKLYDGFKPDMFLQNIEHKELKLTYPVSKDGQWEFVGIVDAVKDNHFVDWKTNYSENADPLQLAIYAWLLSEEFPWHIHWKGSFVYIRLNKAVDYEFELDDLENAKNYVLDKADEMINVKEEPEAKPGAHCAYCPLIEECSKKLDVIGQYKLTKLRLKTFQDIIKTSIKDEPMITKSGTATMAPVERISLSKKLSPKDLPEEMVKVDSTKIKSDPLLLEELKEKGLAKISTYYKMLIE